LVLWKDKSRAAVAHTYNPSYLRGGDQEDHGLEPIQGNSLRNPIVKISNTKEGGWSDSSGRAPVFSKKKR
jgi:hypothetical protein